MIGVGDYARMGRLRARPRTRGPSATLTKNYGFKVRTVVNASRVQIMAQLNDFASG